MEIDTTWEGVHESPLMHHAGETCRARAFVSLAVPRVKRETHGYLAPVGIWSSTSSAYKIKEGSHFNYSMVCHRKQCEGVQTSVSKSLHEPSYILTVGSESVTRSVVSDSFRPQGLLPARLFSRQEYWSGLPFLSPGESPQPRD